MGANPAAPAAYRRDVPLLLSGALVSTVGSALTAVAIMIFLLPRGPGWVAAALAAELVPGAVGAPLAGWIVDHFPNRQLLVASLSLQAAAVAVVALSTSGDSTIGLFLGLIVLGAAASVTNPAVASLLPRVAPTQSSSRVYGWYSAVTQVGFLVGASLAGVMVQVWGTRNTLLIDCASYVIMAIALGLLKVQRQPETRSKAGEKDSIWAGFATIRQDLVLVAGVGGLTIAILATIVVNVADVFFVLEDVKASPAVYGLVTACWPLAGILGAWGAGHLIGDRKLLGALSLAHVSMGISLTLAGAIVTLPALVAAWLIGGAANAVQRVSVNALTADRVSDAVLGRTFAASGSLFQSANLLGLAVGALVVSAIGAPSSLIWAGLCTAAVGCVTWIIARPALRAAPG